MEDNDAQLPLKKRARRRLVGAVFFVSVVAVVLPMVMDQEPRQAVQDIEIRIPGQDEKPFAPKFAAAPAGKTAPKLVEAPAMPQPAAQDAAVEAAAKPTARIVETIKDARPVDKPADRVAEKPIAKPEKVPEKPAIKSIDKPKAEEAKRAAAILAGLGAEVRPPSKNGEYLVLIGAYSNEANVRSLKAKLTEQGIKTFSEPLDTPQGKKTRVRAGPFASREAAENALEKMKRIGVSGVVSAKP